jgi:hypothetical protein
MRSAIARSGAGLVLLATVVALTGCRGLPIGPGGSVAPTDGPIPHPGGDALVLRIEHRGGFVPYEYHLTRPPQFTLLGDGRVVMAGAVPAIYPGPILPPLLERRLTEDGIGRVLRAALDSGALDESATWTGAAQHVADAADTVFTLRADGREVIVRVYALGIGVDLPDLPDAERRAHEALRELERRLFDLESWLPAGAWADDEWQPYRAEAMRLVVRNADGDADTQDGLPLRVLPWPVAGDPARFGDLVEMEGWRCGVVIAAEARAWYEALGEADQLTRWVGGGHRYAVVPRPLLPDEPRTCEAPG